MMGTSGWFGPGRSWSEPKAKLQDWTSDRNSERRAIMRNQYLSMGAVMLLLLVGCGSESESTMVQQSSVSAGTGDPSASGGSAGKPAAASTVVPSGAAGSGMTVTAQPSMAAAGIAAAGTGVSAGNTGAAGAAAPTDPITGGSTADPMAGGATGSGAMMGTCCPDGDCLCHGDPPSEPTDAEGPYQTEMYDIRSAGCVYYPTDAEPPFAAVAISDGFGGSGGCGIAQTGQWGPLYASWGIVAMVIHTGAGDQPQQRGMKLTAAIAAYKMENEKSDSPLQGKLSGRYGTSGFSMGGGGTTFAAMADPMLKTDVAIMAWTPATSGITVPSLFIFGSADGLAGTMGMAAYNSISGDVPKMAVTVQSGHAGQPSSGGGASGRAGLAFQKLFLEGDERWRPILLMVDATEKANIE